MTTVITRVCFCAGAIGFGVFIGVAGLFGLFDQNIKEARAEEKRLRAEKAEKERVLAERERLRRLN